MNIKELKLIELIQAIQAEEIEHTHFPTEALAQSFADSLVVAEWKKIEEHEGTWFCIYKIKKDYL